MTQIVMSRIKASNYLPKVQMKKFCNQWNKGSRVDRSRFLRKIVSISDPHTIAVLCSRSYFELDSETRWVLELKENNKL